MTLKSEEYRWSSAAAHCGLKEGSLLAPLPSYMGGVSQVRWSEWLALPERNKCGQCKLHLLK